MNRHLEWQMCLGLSVWLFDAPYSRAVILRCISYQYISYCSICRPYILCSQFPGAGCEDCMVLYVDTICVFWKRLKNTIHKTRQHTQVTTHNRTKNKVRHTLLTQQDTHAVRHTRGTTHTHTHKNTQTRFNTHYAHNKTHNRYDTWGQQMRVNMVGRPLEDSANHWSYILEMVGIQPITDPVF